MIRLQHRVALQTQATTKDPTTGEQKPTWNDWATVWAAVEPLSGKEFLLAKEVSTELTTRIVIRYRLGVNAGMRVLFGARVYEIVSPPIDKFEEHKFLQLMCAERVPTHPRK